MRNVLISLLIFIFMSCSGNQEIVNQQGTQQDEKKLSDVFDGLLDELKNENSEEVEKGRTIEVEYNDTSALFYLSEFTPLEMDGYTYVRLSDIVNSVDFIGSPEEKKYDFEGSDGFKPTSKGLTPLDFSYLKKGYINIDSGLLRWEPELGLPKTWNVKDCVKIIVLD